MTVSAQSTATAAGLADGYTPMQEREALRLLGEHYGMSGTLKRFATEKDDTFRVHSDEGQSYVLKIANPGECFGEIDFQHAILRAVAAHDPALPVPRVVANRGGSDLFEITDVAGARRFVRLLTFLDGTPLDETRSNAAQRREIGKVLARLRLATQHVSHPSQDRVLAWDVQHLPRLAPLLEEVDDPARKHALASALERFAHVEPGLKQCRRQVLHNDFSQSNIVVDPASTSFVTGIIDFGDAVKTAVAIDVSTALLNQLPREPQGDMFADGRDLLAGYLSVVDLDEQELRLIPHLVMARIVARALITLWRARMFPDNRTYILRNTEQGWHQLAWFLDRSMEDISGILVT